MSKSKKTIGIVGTTGIASTATLKALEEFSKGNMVIEPMDHQAKDSSQPKPPRINFELNQSMPLSYILERMYVEYCKFRSAVGTIKHCKTSKSHNKKSVQIEKLDLYLSRAEELGREVALNNFTTGKDIDMLKLIEKRDSIHKALYSEGGKTSKEIYLLTTELRIYKSLLVKLTSEVKEVKVENTEFLPAYKD